MKDNHKVLQIIDSLFIGGAERMSINIGNTFNSNNIENYLVVSRKSGPLYNFIENKENVCFLNKKGALDCFAFYKLLKLIIKIRPSIIHAHQSSIYWTFLIKIFFPKTILIWHDHWGFGDLLKDSDRKIIKCFSFLIDGVVCVNDKIKAWNIKNLKLKKEAIAYIRNFPVLDSIKREKSEKYVLACVANIKPQKDHVNLLEACVLLKKQNIDFELLLAGSFEDTNYVEKIRKLIIDLKLSNEVKLLGSVDNVSDVLSRADIGILSSVSEGLPVALLEYGLAELPVICTNVGQCNDVLGHGKFGWIVPAKSPQDLAMAIKESYLDRDQSIMKAMSLKNNVEKNYGGEGFILNYFELISYIKNS